MSRFGAGCAAVAILSTTGCFSLDTGPGPRGAAPGASPGGGLRVGIERPLSLDPSDADVHDRAGFLVLSTMCDPLLGLDPVTGEIVPSLVDEWTVDDAAKVFTLTLRRDLKFSDGTDMTALDVAFTLTRVASQAQASPAARLLEQVLGFEIVHGDVPATRAEQREQLDGLNVLSDRSLTISLKESRADFLTTLTHVSLTPLPKQRVESEPERARRQPVCVGPYTMDDSYTPDADGIRLRRSNAYHASGAVHTRGGRGYLDNIEFRIGASRAELNKSYQAGDIDTTPMDPASTGFAAGDLARAPTGVLEYIGLPTRTPPFDNPEVRRALSLALDREALVKAAFPESAVPATSFLPPTSMSELAEAASCEDTTMPATADVAAAREVLKAAKADLTAKPLELTYNAEHDNATLMRAVGEQWRAAFDVVPTLVGQRWQDYQTLSRQPGFVTPFRYGWGAQTPGPDGYLDPLFGSFSVGADNVSQFIDPQFDRTLSKIVRRATDEEPRVSGYARLARSLCLELPMLPVAARTATTAIRRDVLASALETFTDRASGQLLLREIYRTDLSAASP